MVGIDIADALGVSELLATIDDISCLYLALLTFLNLITYSINISAHIFKSSFVSTVVVLCFLVEVGIQLLLLIKIIGIKIICP